MTDDVDRVRNAIERIREVELPWVHSGELEIAVRSAGDALQIAASNLEYALEEYLKELKQSRAERKMPDTQ